MRANRTGLRRLGVAAVSSVAGACALAVWCGCGSDPRLAGRKIRSVVVRSVTHYGLTLDQQATPQQIAYVLLRAIRDDVLAKSKDDRDAALDRQFDLCAANTIQAKNRTSLPRDEFVHSVVYHWAPTVSHYVGDFETQWKNAAVRLIAKKPTKDEKSGVTECEVLMELADPSGDPNARVVLVVWMAQDTGFWRATHLGFYPTRQLKGNAE